jgi:hypothetical protein
MTTPAELHRLQLRLECKEVLACGHLAEFPCANPDGLSMVSVVRYLDGSGEAIFLREDVAAELIATLEGRSVAELLHLPDGARLGELFVKKDFAGRTGMFVARPHPSEFADAEHKDGGWVIRRGAEAVSWAISSREDERAAELGCETSPDHRRQGLARQACAAWADRVLAAGKVAFYSYQFDNLASAALAAALGVELCFESAAFDLVASPGLVSPERPESGRS